MSSDTIIKYPSRRLYHKETGRYVTQSDLLALQKAGHSYQVVTLEGKDVTTDVLSNIVLKQKREELRTLTAEQLFKILKV